MTLTQALNRARSRVAIVGYGRGSFVLHTWSPTANATYQSHTMDYGTVARAAKEAKIHDALEAMDIDDAGFEAFQLAQEDGRWDTLVRNYLKKASQ